MKHETPVEALERRARYASEHPIEGLLTKEQLDEIRARAHEIKGPQTAISVQVDRAALLRHIDALERKGPSMAPYERPR